MNCSGPSGARSPIYSEAAAGRPDAAAQAGPRGGGAGMSAAARKAVRMKKYCAARRKSSVK
jgi:hypothetical protein